MKSKNVIKAPFTDEQVNNLNRYQKLGFIHEFTCGNEHEGDNTLIATKDGWICPTCDYTQNWCHDFMLDVDKIEENWRNSPIGKLVKVQSDVIKFQKSVVEVSIAHNGIFAGTIINVEKETKKYYIGTWSDKKGTYRIKAKKNYCI